MAPAVRVSFLFSLSTALACLLGVHVVAPMPVWSANPASPAREIDALRVQARYAEAAARARELLETRKASSAPLWQIHDATELAASLEIASRLPTRDQSELASADRATARIVQLRFDQRFTEAIATATHQLATRIRLLPSSSADVAASYDLLASVYFECGLYGRALGLAEISLAKRRALFGELHPAVAMSLYRIGRISKDMATSRLGEARTATERALEILDQCPGHDPMLQADVIEAMGHLRRRERHLAEAETLLLRALEMRRELLGDDDPRLARDWIGLGWFYLLQHRLADAERCLVTARENALRNGRRRTREFAEPTGYLGCLRSVQGDDREAATLMRECEALTPVYSNLAPVSFGFERAGDGSDFAEVLVRLGEGTEAWNILDQNQGILASKFESLADLESRRDPRTARLDSLRARTLALERQWRVAQNPRGGILGQENKQEENALLAFLRVDSERMSLELELSRRYADEQEGVSRLRRAQAALAPDEALVGWVPVSGWYQPHAVVRAYVIRHTGPVAWVLLGTFSDDAAMKSWDAPRTRLVQAIADASAWPQRVPPDRQLEEDAHTAYERTFAPLLPYLQGVRHLIVVNSDHGYAFPIESYSDNDGTMMLDRYAISYTPSASLYARMRRDGTATGSRPALVVGAPVFSEEQATEFQEAARHPPESGSAGPYPTGLDGALLRSVLAGDRDSIAKLPFLPCSLQESQKVASLFPGSSIQLGFAACEKELDALCQSGRIRNFGVLHFATHALIDDTQPERSALALSISQLAGPGDAGSRQFDGLLTADEICLGWNLDADLVTLSGCQTGAGARSGTGEIFGLQQALLRAGARSLLVSAWKVDDLATALLMQRFYENLTGSYSETGPYRPGGPLSKVEALREAKRWLRDYVDPEGRHPFAHPTYWSSFMLIGDPS